MLASYVSPFDATAVRLLNGGGCELVAKANMDEFGLGSSNTNSWFGPVVNPLYGDEERIAGGSSGGSAAAVASGMAQFSLGTDTGGSVRLPASYCGVVGFKPTYGRISRWGVVPYAQTLDTVGILSKDIDIIKQVYGVLDQYDEKDPTSLPQSTREAVVTPKKSALSIGVPQEFIIEELSPETKQVWHDTLVQLQEMGHKINMVSIPTIKKSLLTYYTLISAEVASNLSRYDGIRYGFDDNNGESFGEIMAANRSDSLGEETQRRIILGNYTLSSDSGNHYLKATQLRQKLVEEFNNVFNVPHVLLNPSGTPKEDLCDLLICSTSIGTPPTIKEFLKMDEENFLHTYINDILTVPASLAGLPAVSVPQGNHGIQIIGQFGDDSTVLEVAKTLSNCT
jgi:aspartyl-tRNA(Asn)/glutamyl-tRNA(Gln) amidotransferase subunit A